MYPPPENKPCPLNPRDFVDLLDALVQDRIAQSNMAGCDKLTMQERIEVTKRKMTDYLLDIDKRPGIYVKGENQ